jgi:sterol desaturase/sphingolipid hydroxylase (fatty acid hydroxylase superfamily)
VVASLSAAPSWLHPLVILTGGLCCAMLLALHVPAPAAIAAPTAAAAALAAWLERRYPFDVAWALDQGDTKLDAALAAAGLVAAEVVLWSLALVGAHYLSGARQLWPVRWPLAAQVVSYLLLVELLGYWSHRAMHRSGVLWPWHRVHHSARRLYWLNSFRLHPADAVFSTAASLAWAALLGVPAPVLAIGATCSTCHLWLQHSNARLSSARWAPLLASSEFHRWHHIPDPALSQVNYGHLTGIWDWCFGTWRRGEPSAPLEVGAEVS